MASPKAVARIERLIWILIYGGLFASILGLAALSRDAAAGWTLIVAGSIATAAGIVLIWIRARLGPVPTPHSLKKENQ